MRNNKIPITLLIFLLGVSVAFLTLIKLPILYEFAAFLLVGLLVGVAFTYAMKWKLAVLERVVLGFGITVIIVISTGFLLSFFLKNLSFNSFLLSLLLETTILIGLGLFSRKHKRVPALPISLSNIESLRSNQQVQARPLRRLCFSDIRESTIVLAVLSCIFIIRILLPMSILPFPDEMSYMYLAKNMKENLFNISTEPMMTNLIHLHFGTPLNPTDILQGHPLLPVLLSLYFRLVGVSYYSAQIFVLFMQLISFVAAYLICKIVAKAFTEKSLWFGLITVVLVATNPASWYFSDRLLPDVVATTFFASMVYFLLRWLKEKIEDGETNYVWVFATFLFMLLSILSQFIICFALVPIFFVLMAVYKNKINRYFLWLPLLTLIGLYVHGWYFRAIGTGLLYYNIYDFFASLSYLITQFFRSFTAITPFLTTLYITYACPIYYTDGIIVLATLGLIIVLIRMKDFIVNLFVKTKNKLLFLVIGVLLFLCSTFLSSSSIIALLFQLISFFFMYFWLLSAVPILKKKEGFTNLALLIIVICALLIPLAFSVITAAPHSYGYYVWADGNYRFGSDAWSRHMLFVIPFLLILATIGLFENLSQGFNRKKAVWVLFLLFVYVFYLDSKYFLSYITPNESWGSIGYSYQILIPIIGDDVVVNVPRLIALLIVGWKILSWKNVFTVLRKKLHVIVSARARKYTPIFFISLVVFSAIFQYSAIKRTVTCEMPCIDALTAAGKYINENTPANASFITNGFPYLSYYINFRQVICPPINETVFLNMIRNGTVNYVVLFTENNPIQLHRFHYFPYMKKYIASPPSYYMEVYRYDRSTDNRRLFVIYETHFPAEAT